MRNNFDIGITTFSLRYDFVETLINKIRGFGVTNNIFLCINGEKDSDFDEEYRKKILSLCLSNSNVYPIFFVEVRGLSKLWNTLIIHSSKKDILLLNDDIDLITNDIFASVSNHIDSEQYFGLSKINGTFSFFIVNKNLIDELGYFDERLLGFGEEDGDITYRLIESKGKNVHDLYVNGLHNIISNIRHNHISPGVGKYSLFNRKFAFESKYSCHSPKSNISGMFGMPCDKVLDDINLYPYEKFYMDNKNNL
jgi:hypothetical protein